VLRILSAALVAGLVVSGCGGGSRPEPSTARGVPRQLASEWSARASAIADAASAGDGCRALQLASSLRDEVIADESRVPSRLRSPLLASVNSLADRIVCQVPPQTVTVPQQAPPPKPHPKPPPKPHHEHKHHDDQGNQG
jgi:hypothetical protein